MEIITPQNRNFPSLALNKFNIRAIFTFIVLFVTIVLSAQGTSCASSTPLTINGACWSGSITDNVQDAPTISGCSAGTFRREGWFTFTVPTGGSSVTITASSADRNLYLELISSTAACTGLANPNCANSDNTNNSAQTETMTVSLAAGIWYLKVVNAGTSNNNMTINSLCITAPCTTPTNQPTALTLNTLTSSSLNGSFSGATSSPSGYLIVRSTNASAPGLSNGTTYAVGYTGLTPGTTYVVQGSAVTNNSVAYTDTGLTSNTKYYYHIYSYNNSCIGAPFYNNSTPLSNNATTCPAAPTAPLNSSITSTSFTTSWTASVVGGNAAPINYTLEVYTDAGYTTPIVGSPFNAALLTTYTVTGLSAGTTYYYRIKANNGSCNSSYVTGSVLTACATPSAQPTALSLSTVTSTSINGSFTAPGSAPSGYLIVRSSSATAPTLTNGTTYAVGSTALTPGTTYVVQGSAVTSNATSFSDTGLTSNTKYYYYIFSYNNSCTGAPFYRTLVPLTNNATTCPAAPTSPVNSAITSTGFTAGWTASIAGGSAATINYFVEVYTDAGYTTPIAGSPFSAGTAVSYAVTGLTTGTTYYYRIKANNGSCDSSYITGSVLTSCVTPSAQPTVLSLTSVTNTALSGSFTAASPAPTGYLIVRSTSATAPTLTNGTTYATGSTALTPGTTNVIQGSAVVSTATSFTESGLTNNTKYYYYIFSYNANCNGAPFYNTASPLTNFAITCPLKPSAPVNAPITGTTFTVSWNPSSVGGGAATISYTLEVYTDAGYTTPVVGSPFSVGTGVTYTVSGLSPATTYYYRIKANNTSCDSAYLTGSVITGCTTPTAQPTALTLSGISSSTANGTFTAASPAPNGYLIVRSTSTTAPTLVDGTTYAVGYTGLTPGTTYVVQGSAVTSNATSFSDTGLAGNTTYYYYIFSYATGCSGAPAYYTTTPLTNNATTCPATPTAPVNAPIGSANFTVTWTASAGGSAATVNYTLEVYTDAGYTTPITGSPFSVGTATTYNVTGLSPNTAYYYRIIANNGCLSSYLTGTVTTALPACVAPASAATGLAIGTITSSAIPATFSGSANGYLVVYATSATPPTQPVDGTTYTAGNIASLGSGLLFIQSGSSTTITGTGLVGNTMYYIYVYSYTNTACSGGPVYNTAGPLTGSGVTCPAAPNSVTTSGLTQNDFTLNWATPTGGSALPITYTVQVTTDPTFTTDIIDSPFTILDPTTTLDVNDLYSNVTYYYRIMASNGCNSSYVTGSITTLTTPCVAPSQAFNFTNGAITSTAYPATFQGSADGYLVIRSTSATPPTQPVDGVIYNTGNVATLGSGLTFIQSGAAYSITGTGLTSNTQYYYYVYAYTNNLYCVGGPAYNTAGPLVGTGTTCPGAPTAVTASGITLSGFTLGWTAPAGGTSGAITYTLQITTNPAYTANITGSPFSIADPTTTKTVTGLTSGTTYYYRILASNGCSSAYTTGIVTTSITNDDCTGAIALTVNSSVTCTTSTNGTTGGATQSLAGCSGTADDDVWYKFTATATSHIVTVTPNTLVDAVFQVFNSCGGTSLSCVDSTAGYSTESSTITGLTIGTTYYVRVYSYSNGATYQGLFSICVTTPVAPNNNDCAGATTLTVNTSTTCVTSTNGTTQLATQSQAGCSGTADDDVWYKFVAIATSQKITVSPNTLSDAVFQVFSGSCAGLTSINCTNASTGSAIETSTVTGLTIGFTYYVRVYSNSNGSGQGTFSICITTPCSPGPGTGTSTTSCPYITAGATGLNGADPAPVPCYSANTCTNLEAIYADFNDTSSYTVSSIPYAPPYQYNCLANPVSVNVDDVWSSTVNLPFNFCFYGNTYNKVLIGSNGTITFDTVTYAPGGYSGWSITNNLPNTALFLNSIFGVYHDIDPSKGGSVGWELVTLNSGCRALVAAWSDIPMYSTNCNSALYTGMMVLHENSNIIEVYIKEKNVCSTWNGGNAVVGIQNANATLATVAPNRNALDPDWTVNQEAWRFTPAGNSVASVKWYQGAGTTGPVVGTGSTVSVCPTATTIYTAEVTYNFCNGSVVKLTDQSTVTISTGKTWTGAIDTDWSKAGNWSPSGTPTNQDCITIPNVTNKPVISGTNYNATTYNLTVNSGASVTTTTGNNITVTDFVKVNTGGNFYLNNAANLVQINNTATNTGNITIDRTANVKQYDYVYWSTPIKTFNSGSISPTSPSGYVFKWNPTIANSNGGQGNWVPGTETMTVTKGYIALMPATYSPTTPAPFTTTLVGTPNNGTKKATINRGSYTGANYSGTNGTTITNLDDNWNLIGNPYPSSIDALGFLAMNTNINGNVRLWTHGTTVDSSNANPFYGSFVSNYNVNDYVSYNGTGSTPPGFNGKIAACQGFFVIMNDGTAAAGTVTFNNSLRSASYSNSQFYKASSGVTNPLTPTINPHPIQTLPSEDTKNRIWLSLVDSANMAATTLVGYLPDATYDYDRLFDASHKAGTSLGIYSWINDKSVIINGRPAPFDDNDYVTIGTTIPTTGSYVIGINQVDGLFLDASQNIYIEDTATNTIHDLRQSPYTFTANAGNYNDRFILRYKNSALGNTTHNGSTTFGYISNHTLNIQSTLGLAEVAVYDITGKLVIKYKVDGSKNNLREDFPYANGVYIATIKLSDGSSVSKKLIN